MIAFSSCFAACFLALHFVWPTQNAFLTLPSHAKVKIWASCCTCEKISKPHSQRHLQKRKSRTFHHFDALVCYFLCCLWSKIRVQNLPQIGKWKKIHPQTPNVSGGTFCMLVFGSRHLKWDRRNKLNLPGIGLWHPCTNLFHLSQVEIVWNVDIFW